MVLPEINSFVKNRETVEELGTGPEYDENLNGTRDGSPVDSGMISADDDFVKYETINEESIITYGTDPEEYADEQVRFFLCTKINFPARISSIIYKGLEQ